MPRRRLPPEHLPGRLRRVAQLLGETKTNAEIAAELSISKHTVENYVSGIGAGGGETVWIDMQSADGTTDFLVTAGSTGNFSASCWTQNYQYFNVYYLVGGNWTWVGYILLGHINSTYTTYGTQLIYSSGGRAAVAVGTVGSGVGQNPCPHVHVEMFTFSRWSIAHDWDGPYTTSDGMLGPACVQSGTESNPNTCNAQVDSEWVLGHLGGAATSFFEMPNPYYSASPDF